MKQWFTFKAVSFLLAVTFSFKVVLYADFFFPFINFIPTIWTANNTTIYFWHDERYVLKTMMIWKLRLVFDVYTSFSQVIWKKGQHDSDSPPIPPPPPRGNRWFEKHNGTFPFFIKHSYQYIDLSYRLTFRLPQHHTAFLAANWNNNTTSSFPPVNWLIFSSVQIASCHNVNMLLTLIICQSCFLLT